MHHWPYLIVGAVIVAAGVGAALWCVRQIRLAQLTRTWPTVPAFVTRSDIVDYTDSDGSVTYHLDTTYRYEVAGAKHWGEFTRGARSKSHSMELLKRYAVETEIEVHYDPTDSATSFLARRDRKDS